MIVQIGKNGVNVELIDHVIYLLKQKNDVTCKFLKSSLTKKTRFDLKELLEAHFEGKLIGNTYVIKKRKLK